MGALKVDKMTTPEQQEVSQGITEDQAASQLLAKWATPDDEAQPAEAETTEESDAEQPTGDAQADDESEADAEESDDIEIDVGGEKFKVPASQSEQAKKIEAKVKEIEAGTTRKFQEAAELRKVAESRIEAAGQLEQIAQENSDLIADHKMVERRLAVLGQIDVNRLGDDDPVQLTKLNAEYNQLITAKQRIESQYQQNVLKSQKTFNEQHRAKVVQLGEFAKRNIKGWSEDYSNKLMEFSVKELGFSPDALRQGMNEPLIKAIDLAYQGHRVRTADPKAKIVTNTKTLKPGGSQVKTTAHAAAEKARIQLRKTGSLADAALALLTRSNAKRR